MADPWVWRCICCEKPVEIVSPGDDERGWWPDVVGGTLNVHFGYGSQYDDVAAMTGCRHLDRQAMICDDCYKAKRHMVRIVEVRRARRWNVVDNEPGDANGEG